jgi:hypothetical protein
MRLIVAVLFILVLLYKVYAIPLGLIVAFFLTRSLIKRHAPVKAASITLAWIVAIFTPLVSPSQTFFSGTPPTPEFSLGGLVITIAVSLLGSAMATIAAAR